MEGPTRKGVEPPAAYPAPLLLAERMRGMRELVSGNGNPQTVHSQHPVLAIPCQAPATFGGSRGAPVSYGDQGSDILARQWVNFEAVQRPRGKWGTPGSRSTGEPATFLNPENHQNPRGSLHLQAPSWNKQARPCRWTFPQMGI